MKRRKIFFTAGTLIMILTMIVMGPIDAFTHGFFCQEIDYSQFQEQDILQQISLEEGEFEMQFSPLKPHFAGFEINLSNQPEGNTGELVLEVTDWNGKTVDIITADLSAVKEKTWYALYAKAKLKAGKIYTLKISASGCRVYPCLQVVNPAYLPGENVSGNILLAYAYADSTFPFKTKILLCLFLISIWGYLFARIFPLKYKKAVSMAAFGLFLTTVLSWNYMYNSMDTQNDGFADFQVDSETLVTGAIYANQDKAACSDEDKKGYGLGRYYDIKGKFSSYDPKSFITEGDWVNGYSTSAPAVIVEKNPFTKKVAAPGNYIQFGNGEMVRIKDIEEKDKRYIIHLNREGVLTESSCGSLELARFFDESQMPLESCVLSAYDSQYGLHGKIFNCLARMIPGKEQAANLNFLCCFAMAAVAVLIVGLLSQKYNHLLAGCFFVTFWLSPWIVNFARNLFWVEFTWFLPMAAGIFCAWKIHSRKCRIFCYVAAFCTIMLKCLCGYEYISVVMMGLIAFLLTDFATAIAQKNKEMTRLLFRTIFIVGIMALAGFSAALCLHASLKGNGDIVAGIKDIFMEDVLRRTSGADMNEFSSVYWPSFHASIWEVLCRYFHFPTEIITGIHGNLFPLLCIVPLCIFMHEYETKSLNVELLAMYVVFFLASISWFVLAKSHSYIHTHMNYVLWYFGFVQICIYIILDKFSKLVKIQDISYNKLNTHFRKEEEP